MSLQNRVQSFTDGLPSKQHTIITSSPPGYDSQFFQSLSQTNRGAGGMKHPLGPIGEQDGMMNPSEFESNGMLAKRKIIKKR